jgi:T5SS/PEP-CTERM-associated repeat protein
MISTCRIFAGPRAGYRPVATVRLLLASTALVGPFAVWPEGPVRAATVNWTGAVSSDWATGGNWSGNSAPTGADAAFVANNAVNAATVGAGINGVADVVIVGSAAAGTLNVSQGGTLTGSFGQIATGAGLGAVTVTGAGSTWTSTTTLSVGVAGTGTLDVLNGASVQSGFGSLGEFSGSNGSIAVTGSGSLWQMSNDLLVALLGQGTLTISGGGSTVVAGSAYAGFGTGVTGAIIVTTGSTFGVTGTLTVAHKGTGSLQLLAGSTATSAGGTIGNNAGSVGTVTVDGSGSQWTPAGGLDIGRAGQGTLTIGNAGAVVTSSVVLGDSGTGNGSVSVSGTGSQLNITTSVEIGLNGQGSFTVAAGGSAGSNLAYVGRNAGSNGSVSVSGTGSTWTTSNDVIVGFDGQATMTVSGGGSVVNGNAGTIANGASSVASATVTGAGSQWQIASNLTVGNSGAGTLNIANAGTVSVSGIVGVGLNSGSAGTINVGAAPGTAAIAPGALNAASVVFGLGAGALNFNHTGAAYVFGSTLTSLNTTATINQMSGTTILSAPNSAFTGSTVVSGGNLVVNNALGGTSSVSGGTLSGIGSLNAVSVNAGGRLAPGDGTPGSSMTMASLVLQSGAQYAVSLNPATASHAIVTGSAALGGASVNALFSNGSYVAKQYTILTAGNLTGTFNPSVVNSNLPAGFQTSLSYGATNVYLDLSIALPQAAALNENQRSVAGGIASFFDQTGSIPMVFGSLSPSGLAQVSGEIATASQQTTFNAMNQFMGAMMDPLAGSRSGPANADASARAYASQPGPDGRSEAFRSANASVTPRIPGFDQRWGVWAAGFGGSQKTDGNAVVGSNAVTSRLVGTAVGADRRLSADTLLGFAVAGGGTGFSSVEGATGRSDLFQAGAYLRQTRGAAYLNAALAYGWQEIVTDRTVTVAGVDRLHAEFKASAYSGRLEGGYRLATPYLGLTPYGAAQFTTFVLPAYAETVMSGASMFALNYGSKHVTDARTELGLRTDKSLAIARGLVTLRGRFGWAHDFSPDRSISATFQSLPGASFVVSGAAPSRNSVLTTASAEMNWLNGWSASLWLDGEFSAVTRSYAGKALVRYEW